MKYEEIKDNEVPGCKKKQIELVKVAAYMHNECGKVLKKYPLTKKEIRKGRVG